ncbi:MAG: FG-GAP-like repeat-containing protein, partial [Gemmatimonadota bacterium]|nr:FG-GAP-like repeat-containing protein [Gemmatimonadota bacterium]
MRFFVKLFLWVLFPFSVFAQERTFISSNRMVLGTPNDLTASVTFVDLDGDRDLDVVYANGRHWAQMNEVYLNNGSGQFTVGYALGTEKATTYAVPAGDLDGDGDVDIVVANDRAENWVYLNDGT